MKLTSILEGVGLGALVMYLFDPERGTSRRTVLRDQTVAQVRRKRQAIDVMTRDLVNRSQGWQHMARNRFNHEPVTDEVLEQRIRSELGRHCTHPGAIQVMVDGGNVTLMGDVLTNEAQEIVRLLRAMPNVRSVDNQLNVHESAEGVPSLQGAGSLPASRMNPRWSPATSLLMGAAGIMLTVYGTGRRGVSGTIFQLLGSGMVVKAFNDTEHRFDPIQTTQSQVSQSQGPQSLEGNQQGTSGRRRGRKNADQGTGVETETEFATADLEMPEGGGATIL